MTNRKTALITGASGGIGLELAQLFARDGHDLFLVARNEERLRAVAGEIESAHHVKATVIAADLSRPDTPDAILAATRGVIVDALVNNAGFGLAGRFDKLDLRRQLEMVQVNVVALMHLTGLFLPAMVARGSGRILNVASTAGYLPGPFMSVYYATKAFALSFSEALANELAGTGITVTALCPGPTATGFAEAADMTKSRLFRLRKPMSSAVVAQKGYDAMKSGKPVVITGVMNRLMIASSRVSPRALVLGITKTLNR
jgi:uncharacterized protein